MKAHPLQAQSASLLPVAAITAITAALFLSPASAQEPGTGMGGTVTVVVGNVDFAPPGSDSFAPLGQGQVLAQGSTVVTGDGSRAVIVTGPGSSIRLGPNSRMILETMRESSERLLSKRHQVKVKLRSGSMSALVAEDVEPTIDFKIETPQGTAGVRGTFYAVAVEEDKDATYTKVRRGKIYVAPDRKVTGSGILGGRKR